MKYVFYTALATAALSVAATGAMAEGYNKNTGARINYDQVEPSAGYDPDNQRHRTERQRAMRSETIWLREEEVARIQRALLEEGYNAGPVDGILGPRTRSALSRFQQDHNIAGNGRVNDRTLKQLDVNIVRGDYSSLGRDTMHQNRRY